MAWYLVHRGQTTGPYDEFQIRELAFGGHILPGTHCVDVHGRPASIDAIAAIRPPEREGDVGIHTFMFLQRQASGCLGLLVFLAIGALVIITKVGVMLEKATGISVMVILTFPAFVAAAATSLLVSWAVGKSLTAKCSRCNGRARRVRHRTYGWSYAGNLAFRCTDCGHYEVTGYGSRH